MKNIKIELARQGTFIVAILLVHFIFFGYIANIYEKEFPIGVDIIFLNTILFSPRAYMSTLILIAIVFFLAFRENFFEYGLRNSIMLVPIIIAMSWFWSWWINGFNLLIIPLFFITLDGYLTIISILGINLATAIIASILKQKYKEYKSSLTEII
ncbi:MAG: hypothetical protein HWN80_08670 [Candidatus Lokiarchaeota archaeon]|nr:hypothetical protein [Candidatus Lokiarchaeota archaeon]